MSEKKKEKNTYLDRHIWMQMQLVAWMSVEKKETKKMKLLTFADTCQNIGFYVANLQDIDQFISF